MGFFSKSTGPTKAQTANKEIKSIIYATLTNEGQTAIEISKKINTSPQKISALLKQMMEEETARRYIDRGRSFFVKGERTMNNPYTKEERINKMLAQYVPPTTEERIEKLLIENNRLLEELLKKL